MAAEKTDKTSLAPELVEVIRELAKSLKPQDSLDMAGLSEERKKQLREPPPPKRWRDVHVRFPVTGATAVAHVVESAKHKLGRIVSFSKYRHPPDAYVHESEGGKVPDGFGIWAGGLPQHVPEGQEPALGALDPAFRQWRYEMFWKRDLADHIGFELAPHLCADPGAHDPKVTPWQEGRVGAPAEAA